MKVIEKNSGLKIVYGINGSMIFLGDDEMALNLARYERDDANHIDICRDKYGNLVSGVIPGLAEKYVAQIDIPPREYVEKEIAGADADAEAAQEAAEPTEDNMPGGMMNRQTVEREAVPFNIENCTLTLWAL